MTEQLKNNSECTYTIGGVKVYFPVKAYPSQLSMMDKVIRGCHKAQNCLLESPTGSGKTLALLCSSLSWQKAEAKRLTELALEEAKQQREEKFLQEKKKREKVEVKRVLEIVKAEKNDEKEPKADVRDDLSTDSFCSPRTDKEPDTDDEESDVFKTPPKKKKESFAKRILDKIASVIVHPMTSILNQSSEDCLTDTTILNDSSFFNDSSVLNGSSIINYSLQEQNDGDAILPPAQNDCCSPSSACYSNNIETVESIPLVVKKPKIPKIYFGTRTHKQIGQVIKELHRTAFAKDIKISVLASRKFTCIHPRASHPGVDATELCHQLLEPMSGLGCKYNANVPKFSHHDQLRSHDLPEIWDIEDLVKFGKKNCVCPYYLASTLISSANIVFCPYNYLTDPIIRQSKNIRLKGEVIIIDEAHNIEDTCREAASLNLEQTAVVKAANECEEAAREVGGGMAAALMNIANILKSVVRWIDDVEKTITLSDYNQGTITLSGFEAIGGFESYQFGPSNFKEFQNSVTTVFSSEKNEDNADKSMDKETSQSTLTGTAKNIIEGLIFVFGYLFDERYTIDYFVALSKQLLTDSRPSSTPDEDGWYRVRKKPKHESRWSNKLHFWCLNPAVVFNEIKENARCVILTSGTLSPITSFQSELGTQFPIKLEANHVIDQSQCWVGSLGIGPNNVSLNGVFTNTCTYEFQDELGQTVLNICSIVPHGILCFVPSYQLLNKLQERWSCTGILEKICAHKKIMCEPRYGDELDSLMEMFYKTIESTSTGIVGKNVTGVLFLAVFRGKISEGLDFADNNARFVITVGIPFPNVKDSQVMLKKSYNDKHKNEKGLLSGRDWYQIQAFRALNQALGRCIRHRNDWGAILLVDSRFSNQSYYSSLSKWVRSKVQHHYNWNAMIEHLESFIQYRLKLSEKS